MHGDAEHPAEPFVPATLMDVEEHGPARIGVIRRMHLAAGQVPDQPGIDGAEQQIAHLRSLARTGHVIQDPLHLAGRKIRIGNKTRRGRDVVRSPALGADRFHDIGRAPALPHDGVAHRVTRAPVPEHGGFPLVGDADAFDVVGTQTLPIDQIVQHPDLRFQDVEGIVLDPAGLGEMLREGLLGNPPHHRIMIDQQGTRRSGSLVEGDNVRHRDTFPHAASMKRSASKYTEMRSGSFRISWRISS